jgi:hypothetical protein
MNPAPVKGFAELVATKTATPTAQKTLESELAVVDGMNSQTFLTFSRIDREARRPVRAPIGSDGRGKSPVAAERMSGNPPAIESYPLSLSFHSSPIERYRQLR